MPDIKDLIAGLNSLNFNDENADAKEGNGAPEKDAGRQLGDLNLFASAEDLSGEKKSLFGNVQAGVNAPVEKKLDFKDRKNQAACSRRTLVASVDQLLDIHSGNSQDDPNATPFAFALDNELKKSQALEADIEMPSRSSISELLDFDDDSQTGADEKDGDPFANFKFSFNDSDMSKLEKKSEKPSSGLNDALIFNTDDSDPRLSDNLSLDMPKLKLEASQPPILKAEHRRVSSDAFRRSSSHIDSESGLPLDDDPLNILQADNSKSSLPVSVSLSKKRENPNNSRIMVSGSSLQAAAKNANKTGASISDSSLQAASKNDDSVSDNTNGERKNRLTFSMLSQDLEKSLSSLGNAQKTPSVETNRHTESAAQEAQKREIPKTNVEKAQPKPEKTNTVVPESKEKPAAKATPRKATINKEDGEFVFDISSIQSPENKRLSEQNAARTAKTMARKKNTKTAVLLGISVICLVMAVVGLVSSGSSDGDQDISISLDNVGKVDWTRVSSDIDTAYYGFYHQSLERLEQPGVSAEERQTLQGQSLIAVVLSSVHCGNLFVKEASALQSMAQKLSDQCDSDWCRVGVYAWGLWKNDASLLEKTADKLPQSPEFTEIISLIKASVSFIGWDYRTDTYADLESHAHAILDMLKGVSGNTYPLSAWLQAVTHARLGEHERAAELLRSAHLNGNPASPALAMAEIDTQLTLQNMSAVKTQIDALMKLDNLSKLDEARRDQYGLIRDALTLGEEAFIQSIDAYLTKYADAPQAIEGVMHACDLNLHYSSCSQIFIKHLDARPENLDLREALITSTLCSESLDYILLSERTISPTNAQRISKSLEKGLQDAPQRVNFWKQSAAFHFATGNYTLARKAFDEVERGQDILWFGAFLKAFINYQSAKTEAEKQKIKDRLLDAATKVWTPLDSMILAAHLSGIGENKAGYDVLKRAEKIAPNHSELISVLFAFAVNEKDKESAEKALERLKQNNALRNEHEFKHAKLLDSLGQSDIALERMLALINKDKNNPLYLAYVGELFFDQNQIDSALQYLRKALSHDPSLSQIHYYKGRCHFQLGEYDEALNEFTEAATQSSDEIEYALWKGLAMSKLNQSTDAIKAFNGVITAYTSKDEASAVEAKDAARAYYYRAELVKLRPNRAEADKDYQEAIALDPDTDEYKNSYIVYLYESEKLKSALQMIEQQEAKGSVLDARTHFVKGLCLLKLHRSKDAVTAFENALQAGYGDWETSGIIGVREPSELYERLGYLYRDLGRKEDARNALSTLLEKSTALSETARRDIQNDIDKI